eukprot:jgi/Tetstr1/460944/TSEL_006096.t1
MLRTVGCAAGLVFALLCLLPGVPLTLALPDSGDKDCSNKCYEQECDNYGIRYGKFCGVSDKGCPELEPCDDVDACCRRHGMCVGSQGIKAADCHKSFIKCINKHLYDGGEGFSESCPYSEVVPVMEGVTKLTLQLIEKWNVKDDL